MIIIIIIIIITATLRGNVRKLRLPMCGGTPFAVVNIKGEMTTKLIKLIFIYIR